MHDRALYLTTCPQDQGMSGRSLRRLPVLAHARYIGSLPTGAPRITPKASGLPKTATVPGSQSSHGGGAGIETWLDAMERVVESQATERSRLAH